MQITLEREKLLKSIAKVHSIVEKRNIMPILEHVKMDFSDNKLTLTTTDMDITVQDSFDLEEDMQIAFTISVQQIFDITKRLQNCREIEFDMSYITEGKLEMKAGSSKFSLPCLSVEEFPSFEEMKDQVSFSVKSSDLKTILSKTKHAMSSGESRYYLNGVFLHIEQQRLIAAATDVHRLAVASIDISGELDEGIILPKKTVTEIIKLADSVTSDCMLPISINENKIQIAFGSTILTSRLISGKYPNYSSIFNVKMDKRISIDADELARAIELVSTVVEGKTKVVKLHLQNNNLSVSIDSTTHKSEGKIAVAIQSLNVDTYFIDQNDENGARVHDEDNVEITVLLNGKYLLDVLNIVTGPRVHFNVSTATAPIIIKDTAENNCTYVLMPMQLEGM